jgi:hypothetical protein
MRLKRGEIKKVSSKWLLSEKVKYEDLIEKEYKPCMHDSSKLITYAKGQIKRINTELKRRGEA